MSFSQNAEGYLMLMPEVPDAAGKLLGNMPQPLMQRLQRVIKLYRKSLMPCTRASKSVFIL